MDLFSQSDHQLIVFKFTEPPQFEPMDDGGHVYVFLGSAVMFRWKVRSSNPPVQSFKLKKDGNTLLLDNNSQSSFNILGNEAQFQVNFNIFYKRKDGGGYMVL